MAGAERRVLFLCTGNSSRSILAEALLTHLGQGRFRAFSAGSHPRGVVHPQALAQLRRVGLPGEGFRSKSWDEFAAPGAPRMDIVITVCDSAARESCPVWPGAPVAAHWGVDDPGDVPPAEQPAAFERTYRELEARVRKLVALPIDSLSDDALRNHLREIASA
jgi:arsenate reductase (thioredoxin)